MASRSRSNSSVPTNSSTYFISRTSFLRLFCGIFPAGLAVQRGHPPPHLLRCYILDVRCDGPPVPERVDDVAVAVAVELILRGALHRRPQFRRAGDDRVD